MSPYTQVPPAEFVQDHRSTLDGRAVGALLAAQDVAINRRAESVTTAHLYLAFALDLRSPLGAVLLARGLLTSVLGELLDDRSESPRRGPIRGLTTSPDLIAVMERAMEDAEGAGRDRATLADLSVALLAADPSSNGSRLLMSAGFSPADLLRAFETERGEPGRPSP